MGCRLGLRFVGALALGRSPAVDAPRCPQSAHAAATACRLRTAPARPRGAAADRDLEDRASRPSPMMPPGAGRDVGARERAEMPDARAHQGPSSGPPACSQPGRARSVPCPGSVGTVGSFGQLGSNGTTAIAAGRATLGEAIGRRSLSTGGRGAVADRPARSPRALASRSHRVPRLLRGSTYRQLVSDGGVLGSRSPLRASAGLASPWLRRQRGGDPCRSFPPQPEAFSGCGNDVSDRRDRAPVRFDTIEGPTRPHRGYGALGRLPR